MIVTIVNNIVSQMNSGGKSYLFDVGWAEWLNKSVDEFDSTKGLVLFDSDSPFAPNTTNSGRQVMVYKPNIFFAFKANLDWSPLEHDTNCIIPATNAMKEFVTRCEKDNLNIDSISYQSDALALFNQKDVNISGVIVQFRIELRDNPPICVN